MIHKVIKMPDKKVEKIVNPHDHPLIEEAKDYNLIHKLKPSILLPETIARTPDQDFVGNIPVRTEIEVLPADEPKEKKLGWLVWEYLGDGVIGRKKRYQICG